MKGITWSRDSHGLFDYESRHLTKKTLKADKTMMLMRSGNELQLILPDPGQPCGPSRTLLFSLPILRWLVQIFFRIVFFPAVSWWW